MESPPPVPTATKSKDKEKEKEKKKKSTIRSGKKKERKALDTTGGEEKSDDEPRNSNENVDIPVTPSDPENHWEIVKCSTDAVAAPRSKHTAVYFRGAFYVFGGDNGDSRLNDLYEFNLEKKEWREVKTKGNPPEPRYYHSAVVNGTHMYIFGGYTNENNNDLWQYDFDAAQWTHLECAGDVPSKRSGHCAAIHGGNMYVFGGYDGSARLNDIFCFDFENKTWRMVETSGKPPSSRCNFSSSVVGNCMYIFAGHSGAATTSDLYEFNFETCHWRQVETMGDAPPKRLGHTSVYNHGNLYIFGGTSANKLTNDLYCLNLGTREWTNLNTTGDKPERRAYHTAVVADGGSKYMFVFGGSTASNTEYEGRYSPEQAVIYQYRFEKSYPEESLSYDMGKLLERKILTDVTFSVGKKATQFNAHGLILANRCPSLNNLVEKAHKKKKSKKKDKKDRSSTSGQVTTAGANDVTLPDVEPAVFEELLYFIYTGEVTNNISFSLLAPSSASPAPVPTNTSNSSTPTSPESFTLDQVFHLMSLAIEHELPRLIALCERKIRSMVSLQTVIAALKLNEPAGKDGKPAKVISASLKEYCIAFILKQYQEVITQEAFTSLDPTVLVEIMRLNQMSQVDPSVLDSKFKKIGPVEVPLNSLAEDLGKLRKEEKTFDIFFNVRKKKRGAHLVILAARCEYFQGLVRSGQIHKEEPSDVVIGTIIPTPEAYDCFLDYLYTGNTNIPGECAVYLMTTPGFYGLTNDRLRAVCSSNLIPNITQDNLLKILNAANDVKAEQLKEYLLRELVKIYKFLVETKIDEIRNLPKSLLVDIMIAEANWHSCTPQAK